MLCFVYCMTIGFAKLKCSTEPAQNFRTRNQFPVILTSATGMTPTKNRETRLVSDLVMHIHVLERKLKDLHDSNIFIRSQMTRLQERFDIVADSIQEEDSSRLIKALSLRDAQISHLEAEVNELKKVSSLRSAEHDQPTHIPAPIVSRPSMSHRSMKSRSRDHNELTPSEAQRRVASRVDPNRGVNRIVSSMDNSADFKGVSSYRTRRSLVPLDMSNRLIMN